MANRYWVGGTANWDGTAGTKWATASGGTGGASVPTTADDVFFTNLSTGTCTIATGNTGAKSITCTGFTGTIAGTIAITVAGSITLVAGMTYTHIGAVTFTGTGTLTTVGKTFGTVIIDGVGITLTLGSALNISTRNITITNGTFNTGNFSLTANAIISTNANTRSINLGSSTVTVAGNPSIDFTIPTNLTFNAGTSQINVTGGNSQFRGGSQTFYNVSFTSTVINTRTITGANTFRNLVFTSGSTGITQYSISDDQTITNIMNLGASTSITSRIFVRSNVIGTVRAITANTTTALANNCDFRDIAIVGTASPISPTFAGDCGGNSGITFPVSKTVYWNLTGTANWASNGWALTSNGTPNINNFPLAQDTATFTDSGSASTVSFVSYNIGTINASGRTSAMTLGTSLNATIYGNFTLGSGVTISGVSTQTFSGRNTQTFTSAGKTITFPITIDTPDVSFELGDATTTTNTIGFTKGIFNAKNYNLTCTTFTSNNDNVRTLTMGSGLWTLTGTGSVWAYIGLNRTFNKDTADILLSNTTTSTRGFNGGGLTYNKLTIGGTTGTSTLTIRGANSFGELASTKTVAHTISFDVSQGTIDTWSVTGTAGNIVTFNANVAGTRLNFTLTNVTSGIDYLSVTDIGELSGNKFYVGVNSIDGGNNSNVYFTSPPIVSTGNLLIMF